MPSWRQQIFAKPAPDGWAPKFGEKVVVRVTKQQSVGEVLGVGDGLARVIVRYGRGKSIEWYLFDDLRPLPETRNKNRRPKKPAA